jgi:hypothetical protein
MTIRHNIPFWLELSDSYGSTGTNFGIVDQYFVGWLELTKLFGGIIGQQNEGIHQTGIGTKGLGWH